MAESCCKTELETKYKLLFLSMQLCGVVCMHIIETEYASMQVCMSPTVAVKSSNSKNFTVTNLIEYIN